MNTLILHSTQVLFSLEDPAMKNFLHLYSRTFLHARWRYAIFHHLVELLVHDVIGLLEELNGGRKEVTYLRWIEIFTHDYCFSDPAA